MTHQDPTSAIARLLQIMRQLRDPATGCAWDREQTLESIIPHTLEEAHELAEAVGQGAPDAIRDELGDVLLQVVIRARIAECIKRTMQAVRWGKGQPPSPHWELLGRLELERLHGGVERVWVEGKDGARGEWRSKYRKTCGKQGCRACGGRTR